MQQTKNWSEKLQKNYGANIMKKEIVAAYIRLFGKEEAKALIEQRSAETFRILTRKFEETADKLSDMLKRDITDVEIGDVWEIVKKYTAGEIDDRILEAKRNRTPSIPAVGEYARKKRNRESA